MNLSQIQIKSIIDRALNQTGKLRKGGTEACYFCKCGHYKRKLELSMEEFIFHCWVCGLSGNIYTLLKIFNAPKSYYDELHSIIGNYKYHRSYSKNDKPSEISLPNEFLPLSKPINTPEYKNAIAYLKRRGVLIEDIFRYNIGYCESGTYEHCIIIPSYDSRGILNFFIGRRYYDTKGIISFKKPPVSMNIIGFECFINWNEPIILVESVFNATTIRRNAIPLFGKYPSEKLYETMIINGVKKVYVCLDTDAWEDAISISKKFLKLGISPYMVKLVGGKDANEIGFEKSWECIRNSKEFTEEDLLRHTLEL